jgi:integrase
MGTKQLKGTVSIENIDGRTRLRWRHEGKRYALNLFVYNKHNLLQAKRIAVLIEQDLVYGSFDRSLDKYRGKQKVEASVSLDQLSGIEVFEKWVRDVRNMDPEKHINYHSVRNMMKRWEGFEWVQMPRFLAKEPINERTYNRRMAMLKSFVDWLVKEKRMLSNPFEDIRPRRVKKIENPSRKPFSEEEIRQVLEAVRTDKFCPKCSRYKHSFYYPFLYFLFKTGVRNAEAIGLRVRNIHKEKGLIEIKEALARSMNCANASQRTRKETKNGKVRYLPLTQDLQKVLMPFLKDKDPDALVFQSYNGLAIDDKMFQRRIFKPVLEELEIPVRALYACRHTFGSRCIEAGMTPVATAFLMGNNPETALKSYTHLMNLPNTLPRL